MCLRIAAFLTQHGTSLLTIYLANEECGHSRLAVSRL
jgi:hypothetical protein